MPFKDIEGHRRLVDLLARSIDRGTLPPSLIFAGADTRAIAIAVAQALNCQNPVESRIPNPESRDACGVCPACVRIARGAHPDVLVVEPGDSGNIKLRRTPADNARFVIEEVIESTGFRPFEGRRRVTIIDDASAITEDAQNALLKTLEEPPASSVFVLVTPTPDVLLATVRSRCIRLTFASEADAPIDADVRAVAERALLNAAGARDASRRIDAAKELHPKSGEMGAAARGQVAAYLHAMASLLRDAEVVATGSSVPLANADATPLVERLASTYGGERGVRAYAAVDRAIEALDRNAGAKLVADWVLLQL
jgi:DNA polymerase-3 subunit delta'